MKKAVLLALLAVFAIGKFRAQLPEGFLEETVVEDIFLPIGVLFPNAETTIVWDLFGQVWAYPNNEFDFTPDIDIREEVARYGDLGLIGAAVHPDFDNNGYIYLFYCVDFHYIEAFGTAEYDPEFTSEEISLGRITRYTIDPESLTLVEGSRKIILGEEIDEGIPICAPAHGVGSLHFGEDGSLVATTGDGNTWVGTSSSTGYNGEGEPPAFAFDDVALEKGLITESENLGAFRAQYLDGLNGKILRIHPETGEGLPGNPFYDPENPNAKRSKVWALGFRNPYRFTIKPGTGWGNLEDGHPGTIVLSDVGDWVWEEVNVVVDKGSNFGWPMFQGPMVYGYYNNVLTTNANAPNPLSGNGCDPFMNYQDIIQQENLQHENNFSNPCNPQQLIPEEITTFVHERPTLSFANSANENNEIVPLIAALSTFDENGNANYTSVEEMAEVDGESFHGISGTGGIFIQGDNMPPEYKGKYLLADYSGWLKSIEFDETDQPLRIEPWSDDIGAVVNITQNPFDECLYITTITPSEVKKICFGGNLKPVVEVTPDTVYGYGELNIDFDASESYDPEGGELVFDWMFPDGSTGSGETISKTFTPPGASISTSEIFLTATDTGDASTTVSIPISFNNSPPTANILSIDEGELYSILGPTVFDLSAEVTDKDSEANEMDYEWTHILHHNTHFHYLDVFEGNDLPLTIYPTGCNPFEIYWYRIDLKVTDPGGLVATDSRNIYPDCDGTLINEIEEDLVVYPNPTTGQLTLLFKEKVENPIELKISDTAGRVIRKEKVVIFNDRNFFRLNIESFPQGIYLLDLQMDDNRQQIKIVKNEL